MASGAAVLGLAKSPHLRPLLGSVDRRENAKVGIDGVVERPLRSRILCHCAARPTPFGTKPHFRDSCFTNSSDIPSGDRRTRPFLSPSPASPCRVAEQLQKQHRRADIPQPDALDLPAADADYPATTVRADRLLWRVFLAFHRHCGNRDGGVPSDIPPSPSLISSARAA